MASKNIQLIVKLCEAHPYMEMYIMMALDNYSTHVNDNVEEITEQLEGSIIAPRVVIDSARLFTDAFEEHTKNPPVDYFQKPIKKAQISRLINNETPVYFIKPDNYTKDVTAHTINNYDEEFETLSLYTLDEDVVEDVDIDDISTSPKHYL